jgi:6-pyruvoyltetrahydropterin/6-carboxytetrahydropterin synthase
MWKVLAPHINSEDVKLHCIKLYETENNFVEYFGE